LLSSVPFCAVGRTSPFQSRRRDSLFCDDNMAEGQIVNLVQFQSRRRDSLFCDLERDPCSARGVVMFQSRRRDSLFCDRRGPRPSLALNPESRFNPAGGILFFAIRVRPVNCLCRASPMFQSRRRDSLFCDLHRGRISPKATGPSGFNPAGGILFFAIRGLGCSVQLESRSFQSRRRDSLFCDTFHVTTRSRAILVSIPRAGFSFLR